MTDEKNKNFQTSYIAKIFKAKDQFHKSQAQLPIEEKIKILIELQKIAVNIQNNTRFGNSRLVWEIT